MKYSISIIIPTYKRPEMLRRAVKSVLIQDLLPSTTVEIIVCNDESSFDINEVLNDLEFRPPFQLITINQVHNIGSSLNRNSGIERARGDILYFLDDDDELLPFRFTSTLPLFENPKTLIVTAGYYWCEGNHPPILNLPSKKGVVLLNLLSRNILGTSFTACRAVIVKEMGGFDPSVCPCEEFDLWIRILKKYPDCCDIIRAPVSRSFYHRGPKLTKITEKIWNGKLRMVEKFRRILNLNEFIRLRTYMLGELMIHLPSRRTEALKLLGSEPFKIHYLELGILFLRALKEMLRRRCYQVAFDVKIPNIQTVSI